jgi:hypothetical protein
MRKTDESAQQPALPLLSDEMLQAASYRRRAADARRLTQSGLCTVIPRGHVEIGSVRNRYPRSLATTGDKMSMRLAQARAVYPQISRSYQRQVQDPWLVANPGTELL